jgi:hypothetical protein
MKCSIFDALSINLWLLLKAPGYKWSKRGPVATFGESCKERLQQRRQLTILRGYLMPLWIRYAASKE